MAKVGFVGTGEIARCMIDALANQGHEIRVSERNANIATQLADQYTEVSIHANADVVAGSDIVILCLMAKVAEEVLPTLPFRADHSVISVMTDVTLARLAGFCAPATDICLTIPMPFIATGGCPLPVYPDAAAVEALFGADNLILPVESEAAVNAHFAACAISSPLLAQMQQGVDWLAEATGDAVGAEQYITSLFAGYFKSMALDGGGELKALLQSLSAEGGLNATLRQHMQDHGALDDLVSGMDAFRPRLGLPE